MKKLLFTLTLISSACIFYTACKKKKIEGCTDSTALNYNPEATESDGTCEYYNGSESEANTVTGSMAGTTEDLTIYTFVAGEGESDQLENKKSSFDSTTVPSCATVTLDSDGPTIWPKTITIDFGTSGCECFDGKTRKGKIMAKFTGLWKTHSEGDSIIVTFDNYYVNDTMITGTRYFYTDEYVTLTGNLKVGYTAANASIVYPNNGGTISWTAEGTFKISGLTTPTDISDDEFELDIEGSATAVNGDSYSFSTPSELITKVDCLDDCVFIGGSFAVSTEVESDTTVTYGSFSYSYNLETTTTVTFDFGDGSVCDDKFEVTTKLEVNSIDGSTETTLYEETFGPDEYSCSALDSL